MHRTAGQKRHDTVSIKDDNGSINITVKLSAVIYKEGEWYNASCPSLKIYSQGASLREAKDNIIEATELFIESCVARKKLNSALIKRGFVQAMNRAERRRQQKTAKSRHGEHVITFPVHLPLAA